MNQESTKRCIACAEEIQALALLCRYCGTDQRKTSRWTDHKTPELISTDDPIPVEQTLQSESESNPHDDDKSRRNKTVAITALAGAAALVALWGLNEIAGGAGTSSGYSAATACNEISNITSRYFEEFDAFRYSEDNGTGWQRLEDLTLNATSELDQVMEKVRAGITWDSTNVVNNLLLGAQLSMNEIVEAAVNSSFEPGRDLETVLFEISTNLDSVASSACNG